MRLFTIFRNLNASDSPHRFPVRPFQVCKESEPKHTENVVLVITGN